MEEQKIPWHSLALSRRHFLRGLAGTSVAGLFFPGLTDHLAQAQTGADPDRVPPGSVSARVRFDPSSLPILRRADVIVVGGSLAGVAAALEFARAGRKVVMIEERTYLGREIAATLRPWIDAGSLKATQLPEPFAASLKGMKNVPSFGEIPLRMDAFKLAQEDLLLAAGVECFYACLPTEIIQNKGAAVGVVIGNKSGRQALLGSLVLDTTPTAVAARVAGAAFAPAPAGVRRFVRTLEFDKAGPLEQTTLAVPNEFGIAGNQVTVHQGYRGKGHILVECPMDLPADRMDLAGLMAREIEARRRTMRVATHLIQNVAAFSGALLAVCGYELDGPQTTPLTEPVPAWADEFRASALEFKDKHNQPISLPLDRFAGPVRHLWCLGDSSRLPSADHVRLHDPVNAALAGAAFAKAILSRLAAGEGSVPAISTSPDPLGLGSRNSDRNRNQKTTSSLAIKTQDRPQRGRLYEAHSLPALDLPVYRDVDVLVVGGGTSGATSAGVAAREKLRTLVLELNPGLGGTGTIGGVNSYWFGRRCAFAGRNTRRVEAIHRDLKWSKGVWNIEGKMHTLLQDAQESGAEIFFHALTIGTVVDGQRVRGVVAATPYGPVAALGKVIIDATGDGDVAAFAGAEFVYGAARDHIPLWFRLGEYASPGMIRSSFTTPMDTTNVEDYTRAILVGRRRSSAGCHDHVAYVTTRESRHIRGDVMLTLGDELRQRRWPDVVNVHTSNPDIKGLTDSDIVRCGLIPPIQSIEVPYRALLPRGLEGILVAGKAFSADHDAFSALRMQSDLENLGGVVALAAAQAIREGVAPRRIKLADLQRRLVTEGLLTSDQVARRIEETPCDEAGYRAMLGALNADRKLYAYSELKWPFGEKIPFVELCSADPTLAVPILEEELEKTSGPRQLLIAQALALLGSKTGVPVLLAEIDKHLAGPALPPRKNKIPYAGLPPDQAACPDVVYLIYALGLARDPRALPVWQRVADLLLAMPEEFKDKLKCTYYYVDAVSFGAERLGDPAAIPILKKIHDRPTLKGQTVRGWTLQPDITLERRAILEVGLGYALARCKSRKGYEILISYLDDNRTILAEYAHGVLVRLSSADHGKDARAWTQWLHQLAAREGGLVG